MSQIETTPGTAPGATQAPPTPSGEPNGDGYITTEQALENAPLDLAEEDVYDVFGGKVRVRGLTAHESALCQQAGFVSDGRQARVNLVEVERLQFLYGVTKPKFGHDEVRALHLKSGKSFKKVIGRIDELSGLDKAALEAAQTAFPGPNE